MATTTEKPSRRGKGLTPLTSSQHAVLRASERYLKELRMMRILNLKERCMDGDYQIDVATVAEALVREAVIDAAATAITNEDKISQKRAPKSDSRPHRVSAYAHITIERSNSSKHALWHVVGWTTELHRSTLAVTLRQDIAEHLRQRMMRKRTA
jgi:anti-sigma28 factor (negative regulator of flagellin synthesis)